MTPARDGVDLTRIDPFERACSREDGGAMSRGAAPRDGLDSETTGGASAGGFISGVAGGADAEALAGGVAGGPTFCSLYWPA
jgi:hypothetical protein